MEDFDLDITGFPCSVDQRVGNGAARCDIIEYGQDLAFSEIPRTLPTNYLWAAVLHCRGVPQPALMPFLYYLRDPVATGICVLTWKQAETNFKRYRAAMKLTGYQHVGTSRNTEFFTISGQSFSCRTRARKYGSDLSRKSARQLLHHLINLNPNLQPKVLEVFPTRGLFAEEAIKLGCHTNIVVGPRQKERAALRTRFQEKFAHGNS